MEKASVLHKIHPVFETRNNPKAQRLNSLRLYGVAVHWQIEVHSLKRTTDGGEK